MTKRPLWRRLLKGFAIAVAALIAIAVILLGVLHTSIGRSFVRGRIAAKLGQAVDGTAELGAVDYGFLFSHLELHDLVIHDREGREAVKIAALHAVVDRGSLLRGAPVIEELAIDGLDATIVEGAPGKTNLTGLFKPSGSPPPASIQVGRLHVTGAAHLTRADGTIIAIEGLEMAGSASIHPRDKLADVSLSGLTAKVTLAVPRAPVRTLDLGIETLVVAQRGGGVEATIAHVAFGALTIERVHALVDRAPGGAQAISISKAKLDHQKLATLLGQEVFRDDVLLDASLTGPLAKLVVHGGVATRQTTLELDGTLDLSTPALPRYAVTLVGKGASADLFARAPPNVPPIQTDVKLTATGSGLVVPDLDAELGLEVGRTQIGSIVVEGLSAKAHAHRGGLTLERLHAKGLGFTIDASGDVAADTRLHGTLTVAGSPAEASRVLRAAGIAAWYRVPPLAHVEVTVTAAGKPEGALALEVQPMHLALAGGAITVAGSATLDHRVVTHAATTIGLRNLDLGGLARLAHGPAPKVHGTVSGSVAVDRTGDAMRAAYDLNIALPGAVAKVHGNADLVAAELTATIVRDREQLATVHARVAHDAQGLMPDRAWQVSIDAPQRALAELAGFAPDLELPEGDVALHGELAGTPNHPTGTIRATIHAATPAGPQLATVLATLAPSTTGTQVTTHAEVGPIGGARTGAVRDPYAQARASGVAADLALPFAILDGTITLPALFRGRHFDQAGVKQRIAFAELVTIPDRELAHLPLVKPEVARLGGTIGGTAKLTGTPQAPHLAAAFTWRDYPIISGLGRTEVTIAGTPAQLEANLASGPLAIHATATRSNSHLAIETTLHADPSPLAAMLPASLVPDLEGNQPGTLRSDLAAKLALVIRDRRLVLEDVDVSGTLSVKDGAFAVPNSERRWHDLELEIAGAPDGVRLTKLAAREDANRSLEVTGALVVNKEHAADGSLRIAPATAQLRIAMHDWLALGYGPPLLSDAPIATVNLDANIVADLAKPITGIDVTVNALDFAQPDRLEHSHEPEQWQVSSDIVYVDRDHAVGALPVAAPSEPHRMVPLDVKVHIPRPIHALKAPLDLLAKGELAVSVRDTGIETRGIVEVTGGRLVLFGRDHRVVSGSLVFDAAHPHGNFALGFEYTLPPEVVRELAHAGARVTIAGPPTKPQLAMGGAINSTLQEALTTYHAGHPTYISWPGLYPSATAEVQSGFTYYIFGFLSNAMPHLLFLDRAVGWADPDEPRGSYGRIRNLELESYARDRSGRVRVIGRPTVPGRSTAELQLDHLWVDDNQLLVGAGVRAGDRVGGGLGLFFEWSSAH